MGILITNIIDSTDKTVAVINSVKHQQEKPVNFFLWISILVFLIVLIVLIKRRVNNKGLDLSDMSKSDIKDVRKEKLDMENLMNSIHGSRDLYKVLSKKCHPDRFINQPNQKIAEEIFQEITSNQRNYKKLEALKLRAIKELNISF